MSALALPEEAVGRQGRIMNPYDAADLYLGKLTRDGLAATTLHRYQRYLNELGRMYGRHIDIEDITPEMWMKWVDRICAGQKGKHLDRDTVSQRVTIAKRWTYWLADEEFIGRDPLSKMAVPKRKNPVENDNVKWLTPDETQRMLAVAQRDINLGLTPKDRYRKMLCLGVLAYTGGRRSAVSRLRISDYDAMSEPPMLAFHEKGGKFIKKPVSAQLAYLLDEADLAGVWTDTDYLIPSIGHSRNPERDSRVIWRLVKEVAADAKVVADVHTLRRSFACFFLENNPDQLHALKNLMGHSQTSTTEIYLRRLNRQKGMEVVVDLDWGVPLTANRGGPPSKSAAPAASLTTPKGAGA